jgi:hypothetical protein
MPAIRPELRFLLRAAALVTAALALWWLVLRDPMLALLRPPAALALRCLPGAAPDPITLDAAGNWNIRVPMFGAGQGRTDAQGRPMRVRYIVLQADPNMLSPVTFGIPAFWAVLLAAPFGRPTWRALATGTVILWLVSVASLLLFLAWFIDFQLHLVVNPAAAWLLLYAQYLNNYVLPFVAPLVLAVWLNPSLRARIFSLAVPREAPVAPPSPRTRRGKRAARI